LGEKIKNTWEGIICFPAKDRIQKPREIGITMVIDKGMGLAETAELLGICSPYIDFIKFGFGTSALYPPEILEEKVRLIKSFGVDVYPGGTFLEAAILQGKMEQYLNRVKNIGFTAVEVSDGTIRMSKETRQRAISFAAGLDFKVLTEVGKKDSSERLPPGRLADQIKKDLENGALFVIVEGRDSGINAGLYDREGQFRQDELEELLSLLGDQKRIIWEAPLRNQHQELIKRFGPNVSLGNIPPQEVFSLEALRVGLRSDTLAQFCVEFEEEDHD